MEGDVPSSLDPKSEEFHVNPEASSPDPTLDQSACLGVRDVQLSWGSDE